MQQGKSTKWKHFFTDCMHKVFSTMNSLVFRKSDGLLKAFSCYIHVVFPPIYEFSDSQ